MTGEVESILAPKTGYCHPWIRQMLYEGEEARVRRKLEERKKVLPIYQIYNAQGKIVKRDEGGRHLDTFA